MKSIESNIEATGYWISPDNQIFKLKESENHSQWLKENKNIVEKFSKILNEDRIFDEAIKSGWIRIRLEHNNKDLSKIICNITAKNIDLLKTLPDEIKDLIFSTEQMDVSNLNYVSGKIIPKKEFENFLNRQQYVYANKKKLNNLPLSFREANSLFGKFLYYKIVENKVFFSGCNDKIISNFRAIGDLNNKSVHIYNLDIIEEEKGKGFGKKVIQEFISMCEKLGLKTITGIPEKCAFEFWKKMSFKINKKESKYDKLLPYNRGLSSVMIKKLSFREK